MELSTFKKIIDWIVNYGLLTLLIVILTYYGLKISIKIMRFVNLHYKAKNLMYLKVTLPRSDSKLDQEKRTEKDFKEKVAIMAQLYRALYEIRELNLWNLIKTKIWQADNVSFELFVENHQLNFYVVVNKYYKNIVEKQITTFYKSADIQIEEKPYNLYEKGKYAKGYFLYARRAFYYPIRIFKQMEEDPLNDIANVLSKLEEGEKAAVQIIINPVTNEKWREIGRASCRERV